MKNIVNVVKKCIGTFGKNAEDKRLNRRVRQMIFDQQEFDRNLLRTQTDPLDKYQADWERMQKSFQVAISIAKKDPESRRLIVSNMTDFEEVFPCFCFFHFINNKVIIYLRSSDVEKLTDDLVFFDYVISAFEFETTLVIDTVILVFGNVHYEL